MKKERIIIAGVLFVAGISLFGGRAYAEDLSSGDYSDPAESLIEEFANGELSTQEDILSALEELQEKYNLEISDTDKEKVAKALDTVNDLGLDKEKLAEMASEVYDKAIKGKSYESADEIIDAVEEQIADEITSTISESVKETVSTGISDYISAFKKRIKDFFYGITSIWKDL